MAHFNLKGKGRLSTALRSASRAVVKQLAHIPLGSDNPVVASVVVETAVRALPAWSENSHLLTP